MPETSSNSEAGLHLRFEGHDYEERAWPEEVEGGVTEQVTVYKFRGIDITVKATSRLTEQPPQAAFIPERWYESV